MGDKLLINEEITRRDATLGQALGDRLLAQFQSAFPAGAGVTGMAEDAATYTRSAKFLAALRLAMMVALVVGIWIADTRLGIELPHVPLLAAAAVMGLLAACLVWRIRHGLYISANRFTAQLLVDIGLLTFALYWSGGSVMNPFVDLYVVFVCLAALTLPLRQVAMVLIAAVGAHSFLVWNYEPFGLGQSSIGPTDIDDLTKWAHFAVTGSLVALFGCRLAEIARSTRVTLAQARERQARQDAAISFASLAAGTAHEMGTPLNTMAMLLSDMQDAPEFPVEWRNNLHVMGNAIQACKRSLGEMVAVVGADHLPEETRVAVDVMLMGTIQCAETLRPHRRFSLSIDGTGPIPMVLSGPTLRQALLSVLNNAAEVSPQSVDVRVNWTARDVYIDVLDRGPGIPPELRAKLGTTIVSTNKGPHGNGIGVFLASQAVARTGGRLDFLPRFGGGTCARIQLPVSENPS